MHPIASQSKNINLSTAQTSPDQNSCFAFSSKYSSWFLSPIKTIVLIFWNFNFSCPQVCIFFYCFASISSNCSVEIKWMKDFLPAFTTTLVCVELLKFRFFMYDLVAKFVCCFAFPSPATSSCFCPSSINSWFINLFFLTLRIKIVVTPFQSG